MGFGKNNTGAILRSEEIIALATLANSTVIEFGSDIAIEEDFRILKMEVLGMITGITPGEARGLKLGLANGELTVAEIAEAFLADGPVDRNDRGKQERAERFVKVYGMSEGNQADTVAYFHGDQGGPLLTCKPRWTFSNPEGWTNFIFNDTGSTLTTGAVARIVCTYYGLWLP